MSSESALSPASAAAVAKVDECHYFYEDVVYRQTRAGHLQFGMILENSEFVSSDEEDDEEERPKKGHVRVCWHPRGNEDIIPEKKLHLSDRSLMPGDVVKRLSPSNASDDGASKSVNGVVDTQKGYCRNVHVYSSCQIVGTEQVINGVSSKDLQMLEHLFPDVVICLDSWIGMIKEVRYRIHVQFADGSVCVITEDVADQLDDVGDSRDRDSEFRHFEYFPGQLLTGRLRMFEASDWLNCSEELKKQRKGERRNKNVKVTVTHVKEHTIGVQWQCRAFSKNPTHEELQQPDFYVTGKDLDRVKKLNVFAPCTHQIGDRNFYTLKESDKIFRKEEWRRLVRETLNVKSAAKQGGKKKAKQRTTAAAATAKTAAASGTATTTSTTDKKEDEDEYEDMSSDDDDGDDDAAAASGHNRSHHKPSQVSGAGTGTGNVGTPGNPGRRSRKKKLRKSRQLQPERAGLGAGGVGGVGNGVGGPSGPPGLPNIMLVKPGDRVVVETLNTRSEADVIWQDGTFERGIPSRNLFPIHHLDDQEFFCGDFVVRNQSQNPHDQADFNPHGFGVVQSVDHKGRTCMVQWFQIIIEDEEPRVRSLETTEEPVYDLKDHPDFKYRPGSIVIRVANHDRHDETLGENEQPALCFGGQVLDNYPTGRVKVWWADGTETDCWPYDLYKIGEYDSDDEGGLWNDDDEYDEDYEAGSDASWETESEHSVTGDLIEDVAEAAGANDGDGDEDDEASLRPKLAANIEKARIAMTRLEEIFNENPTIQTGCVMKQLLGVYKDCRYLDRLMGTSFFHESHFEGLLEQLKERGRICNAQQAMQQHVRRIFPEGQITALFTPPTSSTSVSQPTAPTTAVIAIPDQEAEVSKNGDANSNNKAPPLAEANSQLSNLLLPVGAGGVGGNLSNSNKSSFDDSGSKASSFEVSTPSGCGGSIGGASAASVASVSAAAPANDSVVSRDSGNDTCAVGGGQSTPDEAMTMVDELAEARKEEARSNQQVCARLCSLMKAQLVKSHEEVTLRYGGQGAVFTQEDLKESPGEAEDDLEGLMSQILSTTRETLNRQLAAFTTVFGGGGAADESADAAAAPNTTTVASPTSANKKMPRGVSTQDIATALYGGVVASPSATATATATATSPQGKEEKIEESVSDASKAGAAGESSASASVSTATPKSDDEKVAETAGVGEFTISEGAPAEHYFKLSLFQPTDPKNFIKFVRKEIRLLKESLPAGIHVKAFEDRMDLYSVMIVGPKKTPYEDGLFFFDFQLSSTYPQTPPTCHYTSYCTDRLNPNLYEDGKVCVSLLGTWSGKGTETWSPNSNMLQLLVSIQGLILVGEPYFNEAGYERQKGTQQGLENSRKYNEMVILKLVQSMSRLIANPPPIFKEEIRQHFAKNAKRFISRLDRWRELSAEPEAPASSETPTAVPAAVPAATPVEVLEEGGVAIPEFPLIPASKGFCISLSKALRNFDIALTRAGIEF